MRSVVKCKPELREISADFSFTGEEMSKLSAEDIRFSPRRGKFYIRKKDGSTVPLCDFVIEEEGDMLEVMDCGPVEPSPDDPVVVDDAPEPRSR